MTQSEIFQNMTKEEIADELRDIEMGIGALLAVISECEIKIPDAHPDPGAIPDCINLGKDAHASIKKLQMYWENKGINPESVEKMKDAINSVLMDDDFYDYLPVKIRQRLEEALTAATLH